MECPNCYDEEVHGTGFNRVVKKRHLDMDRVAYDNGYNYYQCKRCALIRKQKIGCLTSGLIENVSHGEARDLMERPSGGIGVFGTLVLIGIGFVLLSSLSSDD